MPLLASLSRSITGVSSQIVAVEVKRARSLGLQGVPQRPAVDQPFELAGLRRVLKLTVDAAFYMKERLTVVGRLRSRLGVFLRAIGAAFAAAADGLLTWWAPPHFPDQRFNKSTPLPLFSSKTIASSHASAAVFPRCIAIAA